MTLSRAFWMSFRQALLAIVDALERDPDIEFKGPRTSELRKWWKEQRKEQEGS